MLFEGCAGLMEELGIKGSGVCSTAVREIARNDTIYSVVSYETLRGNGDSHPCVTMRFW